MSSFGTCFMAFAQPPSNPFAEIRVASEKRVLSAPDTPWPQPFDGFGLNVR